MMRRTGGGTLGWTLLALPALLFMLATLAYPLADFFWRSLGGAGGPFEYYAALLANPYDRFVLLTTLKVALLTTVLTALLGYPLALLIASVRPALARALVVLVLVPFWTSILVRSYAWIMLLGRRGIVNSVLEWAGLVDEPLPMVFNLVGVLIAMTHILLPYMVLTLLSVMLRLDRQLLMAAESLGASPWRAFRRVLWPLSLPGVAGGCVLVFIFALAFYVTPALLGGRKEVMLAMLIQQQVTGRLAWGEAAATGFVLLALILGTLWVAGRAFKLKGLLTTERGDAASGTGLHRRPSPALVAVGVLVLAFLIFPNLVILPLSFSPTEVFQFPPAGVSLRWYRRFFEDPVWLEALGRSLRVGAAVTVFALAIGTGAAFGLARGRLPGRAAFQGLLISPLVIPHVLIAAGIYIVYARLRLLDTELGLVLAHTALAIPVVVVVVTAAMRAARRDLEQAALSLGATPRQTFAKVTLPLIRPALVTAAVFAFMASFDELIVTIFVAGVHTTTLPLKMWEGATQEITPVLHVVATLLLGVSILALAIGETVRRSARADSGDGARGEKRSLVAKRRRFRRREAPAAEDARGGTAGRASRGDAGSRRPTGPQGVSIRTPEGACRGPQAFGEEFAAARVSVEPRGWLGRRRRDHGGEVTGPGGPPRFRPAAGVSPMGGCDL